MSDTQKKVKVAAGIAGVTTAGLLTAHAITNHEKRKKAELERERRTAKAPDVVATTQSKKLSPLEILEINVEYFQDRFTQFGGDNLPKPSTALFPITLAKRSKFTYEPRPLPYSMVDINPLNPKALGVMHQKNLDKYAIYTLYPSDVIRSLHEDLFWAFVMYHRVDTQKFELLVLRGILEPGIEYTREIYPPGTDMGSGATKLPTTYPFDLETGYPSIPTLSEIFTYPSPFALAYEDFCVAFQDCAQQVLLNANDPYVPYREQYWLFTAIDAYKRVTERSEVPYSQAIDEVPIFGVSDRHPFNFGLFLFVLCRYLFYTEYTEGPLLEYISTMSMTDFRDDTEKKIFFQILRQISALWTRPQQITRALATTILPFDIRVIIGELTAFSPDLDTAIQQLKEAEKTKT